MIEHLNALDLTFEGGAVLHDEELNQIVDYVNSLALKINCDIIPAIENGTYGKPGKDGKDGKDGVGIEGISSLNAFVGAENEEEALRKLGNRNSQSYPPGQYSIGSNVSVGEGQVLFMTSARRRGEENWLYGSDGYIWSIPVQLGIGGNTSDTGTDTENFNYIYCRTKRDVEAEFTSVANRQRDILDWIENNPGGGVKVVNNNQLVYIANVENINLENPSVVDNVNNAWTDHPNGISETFPHEWMVGYKKDDEGIWQYYFGPIMISNYGFNGLDGDGYEYIFARYDTLPTGPLNPMTWGPLSNMDVNGHKWEDDDYLGPSGLVLNIQWNDDPQGVEDVIGHRKEWVSTRKKVNGVWNTFSSPSLWTQYVQPGLQGKNGEFTQFAYINSISIPETPISNSTYPPSGWSITPTTPDFANGEYTWCTTRKITFDENNDPEYGLWQTPYRITGDNGESGEDGDFTEFIYARNNDGETPSAPPHGTYNRDWPNNGVTDHQTVNGVTWYDNPQGVLPNMRWEYVSSRQYNGTTKTWSDYSTPAIWSKYGEKGQDGDGIEYIFYAASNNQITFQGDILPSTWYNAASDSAYQTTSNYIKYNSGWMPDPIDLNNLGQGAVEWVSVRKKQNNSWGPYSLPAIWTRLAKDGVADGYIVDFTNENMPVATTSDGEVNSYSNSGTIQVYHNGNPIYYGNGEDQFDYNIGTIVRSDGVAVNVPNSQENIIEVTRSGATITITMDNIKDFDTKNAYIPVEVILPNGSVSSFNITLFGIAAGPPGETIDLFVSSPSVYTDYNLTTTVPNVLIVGVKIGKEIYNSNPANPNDQRYAESKGFSFEYYYDNDSQHISSVSSSGTIALAANGGTLNGENIPLQSITVQMKYNINGTPTVIDWETIPYTRAAAPGVRGDFKSRVFTRWNMDPNYPSVVAPATPTGGTYESPFPNPNPQNGITWYDGIPSGDEQLWSSVRTFKGDGTETTWSIPQPESDSITLDIEFSPQETEPSTDTLRSAPGESHPSSGIWYDPSNLPSGETMIWRAERKIHNGEYEGNWVITRIYGETGDEGPEGRGILSVARFFAISNVSSVQNETIEPQHYGDWSVSSPSVTSTYPYLWAKEITNFSKFPYNTTKYYCIGAKGDNGIDSQDVEWVYVRTNTNTPPVIVDEGSGDGYWKVDDFRPLAKVSTGRIKGETSAGVETDAGANTVVYCTDDPKGVNDMWKYEWEMKRRKGAANASGRREWNNYLPGTYMTLHNNYAESAYIIDLDNDNDQFGTDSDGMVLVEQERKTVVSVYDGSTKQTISSINVVLSYENGIALEEENGIATWNANASTGEVIIKVLQNTITAFSHSEIRAEITASVANKADKTAVFTLRKLMSGQPGLSPTIYQLNPTNKSFVFNRDSLNRLTPSSRTTTIEVIKTFENSMTKATSTDNLTFDWGFDEDMTGEGTGIVGSSANEIMITNTEALSHYQVWVKLDVGNNTYDYETLPIIKDGSSGPAGNDASEINPNILLRTTFDSIPFIQEKWLGDFTTLLPYYTPTPDEYKINGHNIIYSNQNNSNAVDIYQDVELTGNTWYTLSFWLRQSAYNNQSSRLEVYLSFGGGNSQYADGCIAEHKIDEGNTIVRSDGQSVFSGGSSNPTKHTITFKTVSDMSNVNGCCIRFRFVGGTNVISMPKLEIGKVATAYVANASDLEGRNAPYEEVQYANYDSDAANGNGVPTGNRQGSWTASIPITSNNFPYLWKRVRQRTFDADNQLIPLGAEEGWSYGLMTKPGPKGSTGRMYYPAGEYSSNVTYTRTDDVCPVVFYDNEYWYLDVNTSTNVAPSDSVGNPWKKADHFGMVITEALFSQFAKLGSFVIAGDFFISQNGTLFDSNGVVEELSSRTVNKVYRSNNVPYLILGQEEQEACYKHFKVSDPMVKTLPSSGNYKFRPMKVVNALTGEEWMAEGKVHVSPNGDLTVNDAIIKGSLMSNKVVIVDSSQFQNHSSFLFHDDTYSYKFYTGDTADTLKLKGNVFSLNGHKQDYTLEIVLPPAKFFVGTSIKIINATSSYSYRPGTIVYSLSTIKLTVKHTSNTESGYNQGETYYNNFGIYSPTYIQTGYIFPEYIMYNNYSYVELIAAENWLDPSYYVWALIDAREYQGLTT